MTASSSASTTAPPRATAVPVAEPTSSAPAASAALTGAGTAAPSASGAPIADARTATIKVTTEPAGASVREDATELCAATPCDITFKGDAADPGAAAQARVRAPGLPPRGAHGQAGRRARARAPLPRDLRRWRPSGRPGALGEADRRAGDERLQGSSLLSARPTSPEVETLGWPRRRNRSVSRRTSQWVTGAAPSMHA